MRKIQPLPTYLNANLTGLGMEICSEYMSSLKAFTIHCCWVNYFEVDKRLSKISNQMVGVARACVCWKMY